MLNLFVALALSALPGLAADRDRERKAYVRDRDTPCGFTFKFLRPKPDPSDFSATWEKPLGGGGKRCYQPLPPGASPPAFAPGKRPRLTPFCVPPLPCGVAVSADDEPELSPEQLKVLVAEKRLRPIACPDEPENRCASGEGTLSEATITCDAPVRERNKHTGVYVSGSSTASHGFKTDCRCRGAVMTCRTRSTVKSNTDVGLAFKLCGLRFGVAGRLRPGVAGPQTSVAVKADLNRALLPPPFGAGVDATLRCLRRLHEGQVPDRCPPGELCL